MKGPLPCLVALFLLCWACADDRAERRMEEEIRGLAAEYAAQISTLAADMLINKVYERENIWPLSADLYLRTDKVSLIYGFELPEAAISVENSRGRKILRVRVMNPKKLSVNRENILLLRNYSGPVLETTAGGGQRTVDVDAEMNREIDKADEKYRRKHLEVAKGNLRGFFMVLAAQYGLELMLEFADAP